MKHDEPLDYCPDCGGAIGELHGPSCAQEECPRCGGQLLRCECDFDESPFWSLDSAEFDDLPEVNLEN